jgi:hypothetical protein
MSHRGAMPRGKIRGDESQSSTTAKQALSIKANILILLGDSGQHEF